MPNKKSAAKELRKAVKRNASSQKFANNFKKLTKLSLKKVKAKDQTVKEDVPKTIQALDKAVKKGLIKKNTAARKKSRLMKKINVIK